MLRNCCLKCATQTTHEIQFNYEIRRMEIHTYKLLPRISSTHMLTICGLEFAIFCKRLKYLTTSDQAALSSTYSLCMQCYPRTCADE